MKKLILFAAILFAGISVVNAQEGAASFDKITLKVELKPIQTLVINHDHKSKGVNLVYRTIEDYNNGVTNAEPMEKHLKVYSTGAFQVGVSATNFTSDAGASVMKPNTIEVQASNNTSGTRDKISKKISMTSVDLGNNVKPLITSKGGGFDQDFDVTYKGGKTYAELFVNDNSNIFTSVVTYTIAPN